MDPTWLDEPEEGVTVLADASPTSSTTAPSTAPRRPSLLTAAGHSPGDLDMIDYCEIVAASSEVHAMSRADGPRRRRGPRRSSMAIGLDDLAALDDRGRFAAHLALGGGLDPTWLDLFAEAVRAVTGGDGPADFIDARLELDGARRRRRPHDRAGRPGLDHDRRDDPRRTTSTRSPGAGSTWSRRSSAALPREEKPWIRDLAGRLVAFCRAADRAPDVLFAWSLR